MSDYWLARAGQQYGPFSLEDIQQRAAQGQAEATDLVWTDGMAGWEPLSKVIPARPGPPPVPAPPPVASPIVTAPAPSPIANYTAPATVADANLIPPSLSWGLVLLFAMLTFGIFSWIWAFKQAGFAKKLQPRSNAGMLLLFAIVGFVLTILFSIGMIAVDASAGKAILSLLSTLCNLTGSVLFVVAAFQIRAAMVNYYTTVEPIGLKMSGVMTFFFNILYIQHHLSRIATWKRTGFLQPQA